MKNVKNGDIVEVAIYDEERMFLKRCGVYDTETKTLVETCSQTTINPHVVGAQTSVTKKYGNINSYKYCEKPVHIKEIYNFLHDVGIDDCDYRVLDSSSGDVGYFKESPVNLVEIRDNKMASFSFSRGESVTKGENAAIFHWIYFLLDKGIAIELD